MGNSELEGKVLALARNLEVLGADVSQHFDQDKKHIDYSSLANSLNLDSNLSEEGILEKALTSYSKKLESLSSKKTKDIAAFVDALEGDFSDSCHVKHEYLDDYGWQKYG